MKPDASPPRPTLGAVAAIPAPMTESSTADAAAPSAGGALEPAASSPSKPATPSKGTPSATAGNNASSSSSRAPGLLPTPPASLKKHSRQDDAAGASNAPSEAWCAFIKQVCKKLNMRMVATCTSQGPCWLGSRHARTHARTINPAVFFHKFFARHSYKQYDKDVVAMTCIFLAGKAEENIQNLDAVVEAAYAVRHASHKPPTLDQERLFRTREKVLVHERALLHAINYDVSVEHAHAHALRMMSGLGERAKDIQQITLNILNDSLLTDICLRYAPGLVAAAAVSLALLFHNKKLDREHAARAAASPSPVARNDDGASAHALGDAPRADFLGFSPKQLEPVELELLNTYESAHVLPDNAARGGADAAATKRPRRHEQAP
jgi:hypothetical protein